MIMAERLVRERQQELLREVEATRQARSFVEHEQSRLGFSPQTHVMRTRQVRLWKLNLRIR